MEQTKYYARVESVVGRHKNTTLFNKPSKDE